MFDKLFSITEIESGIKKYKVFRILGFKIKKRIQKGTVYLIDGNERKKVKKIKGLKIHFLGSDSIIEIENNSMPKFKNARIYCSKNSYVKIGSSIYGISNFCIKCGSDSKVEIGRDFSVSSGCILNEEPNVTVTVGDGCLFSNQVYIRSHDGHTIYDKETKKVLNYPEDIKIGNHVWCGNGVRILKGVNIPDDFIVGIGSLVTKKSTSFDANTGGILAGSPAKVLKTGCTWSRLYITDFEKENLEGENNV